MSNRTTGDKRVPMVPPLDGVKDPPTRAALEALVQGWQVRNGQAAATDDHRFITKADLKNFVNDGSIMAGTKAGGGSLGAGGTGNGQPTPIQQMVNDMVNGAVDLVRNSDFFQFLGQRIDAIGPPLAKLGADATRMTTLITAEQTARSDADNSLITSLNTLFAGIAATDRPIWAMKTDGVNIQVSNAAAFAQSYTNLQANVGAQNIALQQESKVRASADGALQAQWSVKIDANGYVSGFGLNSSSPSFGPATSEFYVRADRFAIGSPGVPRVVVGKNPDGSPIYGPTIPSTIPFVVFTTPQVNNGKVLPPGVYMTNAFIQNGAIGSAQIGVAQVDTLVMAGHSVTVPFAGSAASVSITTTPSTLVPIAVSFPSVTYDNDGNPSTPEVAAAPPSSVVLSGSFFMNNLTSPGDSSEIHFQIVKNGSTVLADGAFSVFNGFSYQCALSAVDANPGLFNSYSLIAWSVARPSTLTANATSCVLYAMGAQR